MLIHTSPGGSTPNSKVETPNVKKRHRRAKSGTNKNLDPGQDGGEFTPCMHVGACIYQHSGHTRNNMHAPIPAYTHTQFVIHY